MGRRGRELHEIIGAFKAAHHASRPAAGTRTVAGKISRRGPTPAARPRVGSADDPLDEEAAIYAAMKPDLLAHEGQYVVIKGREVVGIYPTLDEVEDVAFARFGMEPVFVKQIRRDESPAILNILAD